MKNPAESAGGRGRTGRRPDTFFWVEPSAVAGDLVALDPEESRHLLHVHRASKGSPFTAVDGDGGTYECELDSVERSVATGRIVARYRDRGELGASIRLIAGLGDLGSAEAVVELAVPLGVGAIDLTACSRSGRPPLEPPRLERLSRVARAAMKQARRSRLPGIRSSPSLAAAVGETSGGARFFADVDGATQLPGTVMVPEPIVLLAVGPPGGFDETERGLLVERKFVPISLGPSRLRTELAAATLLAVLRNRFICNDLPII